MVWRLNLLYGMRGMAHSLNAKATGLGPGQQRVVEGPPSPPPTLTNRKTAPALPDSEMPCSPL